MWFKIVILVVLFTGCLCVDSKDVDLGGHYCEELNVHFAAAINNFQQCVLYNNENATFCLQCVGEYGVVLSRFSDLMSGTEHSNVPPANRTSCRSRFVDINQLNIVEDAFANVNRLWGEGVCSDCFVPGCNFTKKEDDPQCERSNRTMEFENAYNQTSDCIFSHKKNKSLACIECADLYNDLNKRYDQIRLKAENKFCFVIKFWMNTTQSLWTDKTGCCSKRQPPTSDFFVLSAFSIVISIGFYIATFIIGKRNERVQYIPDDLMPTNTQNRLDDTVMNINDAESTTSTNLLNSPELPDRIQSKPTNYGSILNTSTSSSDDNDDADEDILPIQNPNLIQI